jgi:hypothetical protein
MSLAYSVAVLTLRKALRGSETAASVPLQGVLHGPEDRGTAKREKRLVPPHPGTAAAHQEDAGDVGIRLHGVKASRVESLVIIQRADGNRRTCEQR